MKIEGLNDVNAIKCDINERTDHKNETDENVRMNALTKYEHSTKRASLWDSNLYDFMYR